MDARLTHEDDGLSNGKAKDGKQHSMPCSLTPDPIEHNTATILRIQQHMVHPSRGSIALQALQNAATNRRLVASVVLQAMYRTVHTADQPPQNMADSGIQDKLRTDLFLGVEVNQTECGTERIDPELKVVVA